MLPWRHSAPFFFCFYRWSLMMYCVRDEENFVVFKHTVTARSRQEWNLALADHAAGFRSAAGTSPGRPAEHQAWWVVGSQCRLGHRDIKICDRYTGLFWQIGNGTWHQGKGKGIFVLLVMCNTSVLLNSLSKMRWYIKNMKPSPVGLSIGSLISQIILAEKARFVVLYSN